MTRSILSKRDIRTTLKVGLSKLKVGKIDNKSIIAIGVNGYVIKATNRLCLNDKSAIVHLSI